MTTNYYGAACDIIEFIDSSNEFDPPLPQLNNLSQFWDYMGTDTRLTEEWQRTKKRHKLTDKDIPKIIKSWEEHN